MKTHSHCNRDTTATSSQRGMACSPRRTHAAVALMKRIADVRTNARSASFSSEAMSINGMGLEVTRPATAACAMAQTIGHRRISCARALVAATRRCLFCCRA